jgi:hypothetical protein
MKFNSGVRIGAGALLGVAVVFAAMLMMRSPGEAESVAQKPTTAAVASAAGATISPTEAKLKVEPTGYR